MVTDVINSLYTRSAIISDLVYLSFDLRGNFFVLIDRKKNILAVD